MLIRKLKLAGFKSFVEPAELRIEPGLTGVVGPNGCGKSNLLEAIRWVMGETSAKSMRSGGMDDVIFAGTAQRPPRDFAEVVLPARTDAEGEELEVTRRIERGAGSAYRVNGRDVRAKDVALVFADAATGAHSPVAGQPGQDRRGDRRQAGRAADDARGGARASPGSTSAGATPRSKLSADRGQPRPARGPDGRASTAQIAALRRRQA